MENSLTGHGTHSHRRTSSLGCLSDHASRENEMRTSTDIRRNDRPPVPTLLGYEIMEERAKFTVYKILVRRAPDESWVIFRRYTDFTRLNDKLKEMFPKLRLSLPPKRRFKDNYDMNFLEERQVGLQAFLHNLVAQKDMTKSDIVRGFLCLDDPPGPFDSLEESKAYCETLEETNHRLQRELQDKQREIQSLRRILADRELQISGLEKSKKVCDDLSGVYAVKEDVHAEPLNEATQTDDASDPDRSPELHSASRSHAACWTGSSSEDNAHKYVGVVRTAGMKKIRTIYKMRNDGVPAVPFSSGNRPSAHF